MIGMSEFYKENVVNTTHTFSYTLKSSPINMFDYEQPEIEYYVELICYDNMYDIIEDFFNNV